MQRRKDTTPKERSRPRQTCSNRSTLSSAEYQDIKAVVDRILEHKHHHKEPPRSRHSFTNSRMVKPTIHQPITNNFIVVNHTCPVMEEKREAREGVGKRHFLYRYIIGKGGFGKVWKVEHIKKKKQFAMKEMLKSIVLTKKSVQSILNEQKLLLGLDSPFLVNMHYAFQDRDTLFLVLDLMEGGDLRHHIGNRNFTETQAKFIVACIVLGLEYLHRNHIIHRDIKPENIVLDAQGYLRITDLGIARVCRPQNSCDTSGTPGYMSPEVICRQNHSYVSDYFALGVIAYELMLGKRPYNGYSRQEIRENILSKQVLVKPSQLPENWSMESLDFINALIQRRPEQRLGAKGVHEIKEHPWIRELQWDKIHKKQLSAPFVPTMHKSDFDQDEKITIEDQEEADLIEKNSLLLRKPEMQDLFKNYHFERNTITIPERRSGDRGGRLPQQRTHRAHTNTAVEVNTREMRMAYLLKQLKF